MELTLRIHTEDSDIIELLRRNGTTPEQTILRLLASAAQEQVRIRQGGTQFQYKRRNYR